VAGVLYEANSKNVLYKSIPTVVGVKDPKAMFEAASEPGRSNKPGRSN